MRTQVKSKTVLIWIKRSIAHSPLRILFPDIQLYAEFGPFLENEADSTMDFKG